MYLMKFSFYRIGRILFFIKELSKKLLYYFCSGMVVVWVGCC
jgi:hypothetical protein